MLVPPEVENETVSPPEVSEVPFMPFVVRSTEVVDPEFKPELPTVTPELESEAKGLIVATAEAAVLPEELESLPEVPEGAMQAVTSGSNVNGIVLKRIV